MTLPKHKAAAYTEQIQQHGPMTSTYGQEKGKVTKRRQFMNWVDNKLDESAARGMGMREVPGPRAGEPGYQRYLPKDQRR